ncbi:polysaccharide pyruvyl transferase family protein [Brucella pseudogrignonensis]|uniref:polysaccharide pyruvyl transferase family protein n=1 Tax=Brucella pseudogrignonensis TaxID=419475 RepID=UPI00124F7217|nr:polysaccharide pyruvyl transferase family protein [Brucella pseudogrignonensis]KAB2685058.1 polysaccharide pyruvyl transferase family protein [Brucella pseudogrignonensis]
MRNLLILNGNGVITCRNGQPTVKLPFPDPVDYFRNNDINTGDLLVFDSILKQLEYDKVKNHQLNDKFDVSDVSLDEYQYDAAVLRGSNYITETVDLGYMVDKLKEIKSAIVPLGIGAQASSYKKLNLHNGTIKALHVIADKCESLGVRGNFSAEILNDIGIKNVRVIGCPSFYRSTSPRIRIKTTHYQPGLSFGLTLNKYLWGDYTSSWIKSHRLQRAILLEYFKHKDAYLYSQGEKEESLSTLIGGAEKDELIRKILGQLSVPDTDEARDFLSNRIYSPSIIDDWSSHVEKNIDFMIGFRLHGNVVALQQGIPAVYFTYDTRIRELTSLFGLPSIEIDEFRPVILSEIVESANFEQFERLYEQNYQNYTAFLNENGLSHKMNSQPDPHAFSLPKDEVNSIRVSYDTEKGTEWLRDEVDNLTKWVEDLDKERLRLQTVAGGDAASDPSKYMVIDTLNKRLAELRAETSLYKTKMVKLTKELDAVKVLVSTRDDEIRNANFELKQVMNELNMYRRSKFVRLGNRINEAYHIPVAGHALRLLRKIAIFIVR